MKLVHDWYMVQAGAIDPRARKMVFDDELMGQLIRFVSSHEIGHTLGLRHNFGASSTVPVEKLRDKAWVEENGHTPSIMDYARFNYVAQPEDHISEKGIFPRIGPYDKWAIEWGYKLMPDVTDPDEEKRLLLKSTTQRLERDKRLWFGHETSFFSPESNDPRSQSEDLGDDPVKASEYGIMNLKRVMEGLPEWSKQEDDFDDNLKEMYKAVETEYLQFMAHVGNYLGSRYIESKTDLQEGPVYSPVPRRRQKEVVGYYSRQVFHTPTWLVNPVMVERIGIKPVEELKKVQGTAVGNCINSYVMLNIISLAQTAKDPYTLPEYLKDVEQGIWSELDTHAAIDVYRRNLQKIYIDKLIGVIKPPEQMRTAGGSSTSPADDSDISSYVKIDLAALKSRIKAALPGMQDQMTRYHLMDLESRITKALSGKS
ncbi:MAG TPA: zinc-dependent metalloprotease [Puia sp.]|nr:zinc-dependent metalloprotease [Puia sp.]